MKLVSHYTYCLTVAALFLYLHIDRQNQLMELRRLIPQAENHLKTIIEHNSEMKYEIEQFENPLHLMELARKPEFGHLKIAYDTDITIIRLK